MLLAVSSGCLGVGRLIHPGAWKRRSPKFAFRGFSEVRAVMLTR